MAAGAVGVLVGRGVGVRVRVRVAVGGTAVGVRAGTAVAVGEGAGVALGAAVGTRVAVESLTGVGVSSDGTPIAERISNAHAPSRYIESTANASIPFQLKTKSRTADDRPPVV